MQRSRRAPSRKGGFLLLEVLVSVVVISVGLTYVVRSFSSSTRALETAARFLKSLSLAEEKLWDIEARGATEEGSENGGFEGEREYRWSMEAGGIKDIALCEVKLKIEWEGARGRQRVSVDTYLWDEEESL